VRTRQRPAGVCDGVDGELRCTSKLPLSRDVAYDAIASTLPKGAARWPMQRDRDQCFLQLEAAVVNHMRAMRRPGESYSEVILRLVELETSDLK
jgi:hypothetical protein